MSGRRSSAPPLPAEPHPDDNLVPIEMEKLSRDRRDSAATTGSVDRAVDATEDAQGKGVEAEEDEEHNEHCHGPYVCRLDDTWEVHDPEFYRACLAEFIASMFFVSFSIAASLSTGTVFANNPAGGHVFIILWHVFLVIILVYSFGALSGAHFNPAITFAVLCAKRVTIVRCVGYIIAQTLGAIIGAAVMKGAIHTELEGTLSVPHRNPDTTVGEAFLMELYITLGLVFGAFATAFDPRGWGQLGPVAIAIIVGLNIQVGGAVSGGVMNPIRHFGPAVVTANMEDWWLYWVAPMLGGAMGALIYENAFMERELARPSVRHVPSTTGASAETVGEKDIQRRLGTHRRRRARELHSATI